MYYTYYTIFVYIYLQVSSMMQEQIVELTNILKEAKEQIIEIENLQKYLGTTRKELIHCKDNVS